MEEIRVAVNAGKADKGSRLCLQEFVNAPQKQATLNDLLISSSPSLLSFGPTEINWRSPLASLNYKEYRDDFLDALGLQQFATILRDFWPAQGPQWDGLAVLTNQAGAKAVLLVEAKAHPAETESSMGATARESIDQIMRAFARTQGFMGVTRGNWTHGAYQLANRLAFLYCMNELMGVSTYLGLVNFVGDTTYRATCLAEWQKHYGEVFEHLGLHPGCRLLDRVLLAYPTVS